MLDNKEDLKIIRETVYNLNEFLGLLLPTSSISVSGLFSDEGVDVELVSGEVISNCDVTGMGLGGVFIMLTGAPIGDAGECMEKERSFYPYSQIKCLRTYNPLYPRAK